MTLTLRSIIIWHNRSTRYFVSLKLVIIEKEKDVKQRELFKIASRIKNIYVETGSFPEKAYSAS